MMMRKWSSLTVFFKKEMHNMIDKKEQHTANLAGDPLRSPAAAMKDR